MIVSTNEKVKLNSFISHSGLCSRRKADLLILQGKIFVNGEKITKLGEIINDTDVVAFKNKILKIEKNFEYILLNKPINCITTASDPQHRKTVFDILKDKIKARIFPVGRLDRNTTGLLLLTNDGALTQKLTHPSSNVKKKYKLILDRDITHDDEKKIKKGFYLEDGFFKFDEINISPDDRKNIIVTLHSGRNRIIRRFFQNIGYKIKMLDRFFYAGLIKKNIKQGEYRKLSKDEINKLKKL